MASPATISWKVLLQIGVIIVAAFLIYWPALRGDWQWDDDRYITDNYLLRTLSGLGKIWLEPGVTLDYYPVSATVQWMQWQLWGLHTLGYHLTNVWLHIVGSLLVWRLLSKFKLRLAWLGGLLFAIHPVQVESVAWIAELKNTLSLPLLVAAMIRWIDYDERKKAQDYWLALALFVIAMLCKLSVVLLPLVLLLYAWWKRGRIGASDVKASAPFFAAALSVGLVTVLGGMWDQQFNHQPPDFYPPGGIWGRIVLAGQAAVFYFSKVFLPVDLLPIYPLWPVDYTSPLAYLPWLILAVVISWLWSKRKSWGRHGLLGLGFFLINLAPCPGFLPAPNMGYAWVMDHFLYLPIIGLVGLVVAALGQLGERIAAPLRLGAIGVVALIAVALAWESRGYAGLYVNQQTLWSYTLQQNPQAWLAHNNLGLVLKQAGRLPEAIDQFKLALKIDPGCAQAQVNLGTVLMQMGDGPQAIEQYEQALKMKPDFKEGYNDLGLALHRTGRAQEAIEQYERALKISPDFAEAHNNLGIAFLESGRAQEAAEQFEEAVRINPDYAEAHGNLGNALLALDRTPEAMDQYEQALQIKPDFAEAHYNLGMALMQTGRTSEALDQYEQALQINPDYFDAHLNLGNALLQMGRVAQALEQYERAVQVAPESAVAYYDLGNALLQSGSRSEAIETYRKALEFDPGRAETHNNLGYALLQTGRLTEAAEQFEQTLKINPNFTQARANLEKARAVLKSGPAPK